MIWWLGMIFLVFGAVGNIVAVNYGNIILLSSSSSFNLIFSMMLSVIILKETCGPVDLVSVVVICMGTISCILAAKTSDKVLKGDDINS